MNGRDPEQFPRPFTVGYDAETEEYYIFAPEGCVLVNGMAAAINGADASGNVIIDEPADYLWAHVKKATSGEGYEVFFDGSDTMANSKWDFRVARFGEEDNDGSQYDLATGVVNLGSSNEVDDKSIDWRTDRASQSAPEVKSLEIKGWKTQESTAETLADALGLNDKEYEGGGGDDYGGVGAPVEDGGDSGGDAGTERQVLGRNGPDGALEYMPLGKRKGDGVAEDAGEADSDVDCAHDANGVGGGVNPTADHGRGGMDPTGGSSGGIHGGGGISGGTNGCDC